MTTPLPPDARPASQEKEPDIDPCFDRCNDLATAVRLQRERAEAAEARVTAWRSWAQFVYLGGGHPQGSDDDLQTAVCAKHDADYIPMRDRAEAAEAEQRRLQQENDELRTQTACEAWPRVVELREELTALKAEQEAAAAALGNELRQIAAWIRTPGNIDREDAIDSCARVLENRAAALPPLSGKEGR
jgi:hypothetical protein